MKRVLVPLFALSCAFAFVPAASAQAPAKAPAPAEKKEATAVDPVCGMKVHTDKAAATATYQGKTYYFCSKSDKTAFEKDPAKYVKK